RSITVAYRTTRGVAPAVLVLPHHSPREIWIVPILPADHTPAQMPVMRGEAARPEFVPALERNVVQRQEVAHQPPPTLADDDTAVRRRLGRRHVALRAGHAAKERGKAGDAGLGGAHQRTT